MRVVRLAALIATAQMAVVVIIFSFGYSIAHAAGSVVYSQTDNSGTISGTFSFNTGTTTLSSPLNYSSTYYAHFAIKTNDPSSQAYILLLAPGGTQCAYGVSSLITDTNYHTLDIPLTLTNPSYCTGVNLIPHFQFGVHTYAQNSVESDTTNTYAYLILTSGGTYTPPPANGVAFNAILPVSGTTTTSTSVEFKAQYYVASTTIEAQSGHGGFGLSSTPYYINLTRQDIASSSQYFIGYGAGNDAWNTLDTTITLPASSTWEVSWTSVDSASPWPTYQQSNYYFFSVLSNASLSGLGIAGLDQIPLLSSASTTAIAPAPCGITDISGCFQNALVYLFYPSTASISQYATLWTTVENKPPFGYVLAVQNAVGGFTTSGTETFDFGTLPFVSTIFNPIRTGIAALLWLVFIVAFYHRLSTLDI